MCRVLAYLGEPLPLRHPLYVTDNSLVRQSYSPRMMNTFLNLAGFGVLGWDRRSVDPETPFAYRVTTLPAFDRNLRDLAGKIAPSCMIAHVRGVTYSGHEVIADTNLHPFRFRQAHVALAHNGHLREFRRMRYELLPHLRADVAQCIEGTTDSEWIYALVISQLDDPFGLPGAGELADAVAAALRILREIRGRLGIDTSSRRAARWSPPASRSTTAGTRPATRCWRPTCRTSPSGTRSAANTPTATAAGR